MPQCEAKVLLHTCSRAHKHISGPGIIALVGPSWPDDLAKLVSWQHHVWGEAGILKAAAGGWVGGGGGDRGALQEKKTLLRETVLL